MKPIIRLVAAAALAAAGLAMFWSPVRAQIPPEVTITFKLTINGTPPPTDSFGVEWGETGLQFCDPCVGGGHTYVQTTPWPKGTAFIHFRFSRVTLSPGSPRRIVHVQDFGQQPISGLANATVSAFFSYANATNVQVPNTGAAASLPDGAGFVGAGILALYGWKRYRRRSE